MRSLRSNRWLPVALIGLTVSACDVMSPSDPGALVPKTVMEDASIPAIEMNGSRFHVQTMGDSTKPVIVFLHGGPGGDYRSMLRLAERYGGRSLADDYFLVFWDQRGSGLSERMAKGTLTIDRYVADLDALLDRYSAGRKAYLVGLSWGGMFATKYINERPQRVAGAVLIEPGPLDGVTMERLKGDIQDFRIGSELVNDIAWNGQFLSPDDHARMDFERMLGVRDGQSKFHLSRTDPEPAWRLGAFASRYIMEDAQDGHGKFNFDFTTKLAAYTTPVLIVAGSRSDVLGPSLQEKQVRRFPHASLQVVNGVGHDVAWVRAPEVLALVESYLDARQGGVR